MTEQTRLALARVQVTDVVVRLARRLNAAGERRAVEIMLGAVPAIAAEIAQEQAEQAAAAIARLHDYGRSA